MIVVTSFMFAAYEYMIFMRGITIKYEDIKTNDNKKSREYLLAEFYVKAIVYLAFVDFNFTFLMYLDILIE